MHLTAVLLTDLDPCLFEGAGPDELVIDHRARVEVVQVAGAVDLDPAYGADDHGFLDQPALIQPLGEAFNVGRVERFADPGVHRGADGGEPRRVAAVLGVLGEHRAEAAVAFVPEPGWADACLLRAWVGLGRFGDRVQHVGAGFGDALGHLDHTVHQVSTSSSSLRPRICCAPRAVSASAAIRARVWAMSTARRSLRGWPSGPVMLDGGRVIAATPARPSSAPGSAARTSPRQARGIPGCCK